MIKMAGLRRARTTWVVLLVALALGLSACGGDDAGAPTTEDAPEAPAEDIAPTTEEAAEEPAATEEVAEGTDEPEPTTEATNAGEAPAEGDGRNVCEGIDGQGRTVGFANLGESVPFAVLVREGIERVAEDCNVEILNADNQLDGQVALNNARTFVTQQVDGVIEFQVDGGISAAICEVLGDLPVIAIDIAHPECAVFMGADNRVAGEITGEGVGALVQSEWDCQIDRIVTFEGFASGQVSVDRLNGSIAGVQTVCPDVDYGGFEEWAPSQSSGIVTRIDADRTDPAFSQGRDWLTANPDAERIVALCLNEDSCTGFHSAVQAAGRDGQVIFGSNGADPSAHDLIRNDPWYAGASGFFPEDYGELVVPNIVRMMDGEEPESDPLLVEHVFISAENIDEYYPQ